jgi:hypothetical protein
LGGAERNGGQRPDATNKVDRVKNQGLRTFVSVGAAIAVIFFGSGPEEGNGISNAVLLLAVVAGIIVWNLTKPGTNKPVG